MIDLRFFYTALHLLYTVIANQTLLKTRGKICVYQPTADVIRKEKEIGQMTDQPQPDYERIRRELLNLAAMKYDCCTFDDRQQKTAQLKEILTGRDQMNELDMDVFKACVSAVRISHYYAIELELANGIIIQNTTERTDNANGNSTECAHHFSETADK